MADGTQHGFGFPEIHAPRLRPGEIVVDLFAGGGGASVALEAALQRQVDIAINHDEFAVGMHAANHTLTLHKREDVWVADPLALAVGRAVGWLHASPDCTHFSQARGGQPRSKKVRALSWVVIKWVGRLHAAGLAPRYISLENVEQILTWGPLVAKRDKATGRVVTLDMVPWIDEETGKPVRRRGKVVMTNRIADPGERVPVERQALVPDKRHAGRTWRQFVAMLEGFGYRVEWRKVVAAGYEIPGICAAGTSRKRLFLVARNDGQPIAWPAPTRGPGKPLPLVTAGDCIDWSLKCPSIFTRKKPLADATLRRIARGVKRFVIDAAEPFIVRTDMHQSNAGCAFSAVDPINTISTAGGFAAVQPVIAPILTEHANASRAAAWPVDEPLRTQCAQVKGGHFALAAAHLVKFRGASDGSDAGEPMPTITSGAGAVRPAGAAHALGVVTAFLEQANGSGPNGHPARARGADEPLSTVTGAGSQQRLCTAHLQPIDAGETRGVSGPPDARRSAEKLGVQESGDAPHEPASIGLSPDHEAGALRVAAFLVNYYGNGTALDVRDPVDTVTTRDRLALVTVYLRGVPYVIVDIGLRMLKPHELYKAQGFPPDYIIDRTADGRRLTVSQQVRMVGNSVSPPPLFAIVDANLPAVVPVKVAA